MQENNKNYKLENFTVLSNLIADPVCVVDEKGTFLAVNQAMSQVLGFDEQELVGKNVMNLGFLDQENKGILLKNFEKRMKGLDVASYEVEATAKNGEIKFFEIKGKKIWYANKNVDLVVLHDVTEQKKKTEERIRLSEEKYKNLFENAPDVIVTIDLTGKITSVNKAIMQHGFRENEIVGRSIFKLVPIKYNQKMLTGLKNIAAGNSTQGEIEILTPNGKRSAEYNSNPIRVNGKVVGYQTIIRDVTERKKTEEALRESEEKHRKLFEESMDAIFMADAATGIIVDCNPAASKLVGREKSELVGQHQSIIHPKEQIEGGFTGSFKQHLKDPTKTLEMQIMRKTGEIRDVAVSGTTVELKGKKLIQGIFRDIADLKKAEEALRESEQRWATTLASIGDAVIATDLSGRVAFMNSAAEGLTGWALSEASKKPIREVFHIVNEQNRLEVEDPVSKVLDKGLIVGLTNRTVLIRKNGTEVAIDDSGAAIKDKEGKVTGVVLVFRDITDIRKVQDALNEK